MRHRKRRSKLGMMTAHRNATMRNMVRSLIKYQRIETTVARAKEVRRLAEHVITIAKSDTVFARRRVYDVLSDRDLVGKLFKEIIPLFKNRNSGFTRIIPLGFRRGDGASLAILELTERTIVEKKPKTKKMSAKEEAKTEVAREEKEHAAEEKKHKEEHKKDETKIKAMPKSKSTLDEEKRHEKAKSEDRKMSGTKPGFMKNLRGLFRKRGDF